VTIRPEIFSPCVFVCYDHLPRLASLIFISLIIYKNKNRMKRKLSKGLILGKRSIAVLSNDAMAKIDGGTYTTPTYYCGVSGVSGNPNCTPGGSIPSNGDPNNPPGGGGGGGGGYGGGVGSADTNCFNSTWPNQC
jgi:hypothetical protein